MELTAKLYSIGPANNWPTAVNAIFTALNEILSVDLSGNGIRRRRRLRENAALLMR